MKRLGIVLGVLAVLVAASWAFRYRTVECYAGVPDDFVYECVEVNRWTGSTRINYVAGSYGKMRDAQERAAGLPNVDPWWRLHRDTAQVDTTQAR